MTKRSPYRYREYLVSRESATWVLSYWSFVAEVKPPASAPYTVWPDGCVSLSVPLVAGQPGPLLFVGPRVLALQPPVTAGVELWGLRFWPDAAGTLFGVAAADLRDRSGPAPTSLQRWASGLRESLAAARSEQARVAALEQWTRARLAGVAPPDEAVRRAVRAIVQARGTTRMGEVAATAGLSLRQLQRRFVARTGLTLREWARVRRLRESLAERLQSESASWSQIAAELGFVDHAHLTREFVQLTGISPRRAAQALRDIAHENVRP